MSTSNVGATSDSSSLLNSLNGSSSASTSSAASDPGQTLNTTFLQLLVAQLNNQDPMNPLDSSQMTSQLAEINTVSGISTLNTTVQSLLSQFQQLESMQATSLAGTPVVVPGNSITLGSSGSAGAGVQLGAAANAVTVQISDSNGNLVRTLNLGAEGAGLQTFAWNGQTNAGTTAAAGNYTFTVSATSTSGSAVSASPYMVQQVTGVSTNSDSGFDFSLGNGSQVPYTSVGQFL